MDHEIKERLLVAATRSPPQCVSQIVHLSAPLGNRFAATNLVSAIDLSPSETGWPASCDTAPHPGPMSQTRPCLVTVRSFSTSSRPALRAASGRPPARQSHGGHRGTGLTHAPGDRLPARSIARHPHRLAQPCTDTPSVRAAMLVRRWPDAKQLRSKIEPRMLPMCRCIPTNCRSLLRPCASWWISSSPRGGTCPSGRSLHRGR
jgi:hypothetical protein